MIVDNTNDLNVLFPLFYRTQAIRISNPGQVVELLLDFLPQSPNRSILITSRSRDLAYELTGSHASIVEVKLMDKSDTLAFL